MITSRLFLPGILGALLLGCSSEDPRIPKALYDEAYAKFTKEKQYLQAKALYEQLLQGYPNATEAAQARRDLMSVELFLKGEIEKQQKELRAALRRTADALSRYRTKQGEYPPTLQTLVPEYLDKVPETPWAHPFFYRPYVSQPITDIPGKRGTVTQRFNTKLDAYHLASLGTDLQPGGADLAGDTLIVNGEFFAEKTLPKIPMPQPLR